MAEPFSSLKLLVTRTQWIFDIVPPNPHSLTPAILHTPGRDWSKISGLEFRLLKKGIQAEKIFTGPQGGNKDPVD